MTSSTGRGLRTVSKATRKPSSRRRRAADARSAPTTRGTARVSVRVSSTTAAATTPARSRPPRTHGQIGRRRAGSGRSGAAGSAASGGAAAAETAPKALVAGPWGGAAAPARAASSAAMNASASAKRSSGSLASARRTTASSAGGTRGSIRLGGTGVSATCLSAIVTALSPSNGTRPVSSSWRRTPIE
jgi:hypothetical protein